MADVNDPLPGIGGQIDFVMPREILEPLLDVRLFHESEPQLDANDAAAVLVAVEDGHVIAIFEDIGDFGMRDFDEDEMSRQQPVALP